MSFILPLPDTLQSLTWTLIGVTFGRAFGVKLDQDVQNSDWYKSLTPLWKNLVARGLDFFHHFWVGLLLMSYGSGAYYWFGYGLFVNDLPDIPARFAGYFKYLSR